MCGIAGSLSLDGAPADEQRARLMADVLLHRGPDSSGSWSDGPLAFGHNRLKIIDTSDAGRQPMPNEDETVWLNYNGEAYNYRELRPELERAGHRFHSATDTEVLVHAYEEWGDEFVQRINGMFAFALWDAPRQRLLLARDRLGVKPLYLAQHGGSLLFASEIKALLAVLPAMPTPNAGAIANYVGLDYVDHTEETFFSGITQLLPGHLLVAEHGSLRIRRWWDITAPQDLISGPEAAEEFRSLFEDAVRIRLRSDVPLGSCLSGGLDSSAVVGVVGALLQNGADADAVGHVLRTFSAVFPGEPFDESGYIEAVVAANPVEPHRVASDPSPLLETSRRVVRQQDEPFGSTSILAQWDVMRLAREAGVTVLLDGQGGDELLGGYHSFVGFRIADLILSGRVDRAARELRAYSERQGGAWRRALRLAVVPFVPGFLRSKARLRDKSAAATLTPETRRLAAEPTLTVPPGLDRLGSERYRIYRQGLPALLRYEDRNSMAFSIEARLPFLDYRLVELSFRLDPSVLINDGTPKWLLRHALADRLPAAVRDRQDKVGFETPQARWLREAGPEVDALVGRAGFGGGYLEPRAVRTLVERQRRNGGDDFAVWRCLCLDLWLQELVGA